MKVHKGKGPSVEDARNLAQRGDMTGALSLFNRILEAQPNNEEALFGTGGVFFKQGEPKKAIEHWLKLKVLNPLYPNLDNWIQQAKQKLPPPTAPRKHPATSPSQLGIGAEEDWQHQPVRLSEKDQQKAFASASSHVIEPPETKPEVERILQADDGIVRSKAWVIPLGWALLVVYIGLIWLLYFSSVFSG